MASQTSLIQIIDLIIKQIDRVQVLQEHWNLIATYLTILQHELDQTNVVKISIKLQNDLEQTLTVIQALVISCSEIEFDLNGVAYRDLESLLLRLQIRLAQYRADLTDDYQMKVQILGNAYHEQRVFVQKVFDEKLKQRLESIEKETRESTIKHLQLLRKKYFNIIKLYLHGCTELHKSVPLTGLTANIVIKVAQNFYQISFNEQTQLQSKWQSCDLPLTRTFIQFKPDRSTSFERNEARRLLMEPETDILQGPRSRKVASKGVWERLVSAPYMMSMIERDRYAQEQDEDDVSEETIIRTKRWIVILGDPGSGKTSFSRWLVHHLAQTLLLNDQHSTDYGPLRIPILIRIGEFAEILKQQPTLTLFDYIGKHKWMGKDIIDDSSISLDHLSCALQDYIKHGHALIILDGLDEIPVSDQRSLIINTVENFVDTYVQTPTGGSAFDNAYLSRLLDDPSRSGGNQLIVTSRIVGYHAAPLAGQFAHYTIRPMDMEHMKDFVDYWFFRVHQQIIDTLDLPIPNQGENHGEALKNELEKKESNNGLLDVASNSCLLSFICSVAFSQFEGSPLPTQRIRLYEAIVNSMLTLWSSKRSTIPIPDLIRILSDIATYIHGNSASGLIHEDKMKEICIQSIKEYSSKTLRSKESDAVIENEANAFVRIIREDVGILAARGESLYGFLHLTFQEYFTCLKLIDPDNMKQENKLQLIAQSLRSQTNDPRFRVPIALALGKISLSWSKQDFNNFCVKFIEEQDEFISLIPLGAYTLLSCSNDFVNYPSNGVLFDTLNRLIIAAGQHKWSIVCPFLFDHITTALRKLRNDVVSLWINNLLSQSSLHNIQTISALCHLLEGKPHEYENIKWLNQSSCLMLQHLSTQDNEMNEFAIDRLLVKIAFSNHRLLPVNSSTFKEFLITEEIEVHSIPVTLYPLIITLYGGLKRDGGSVIFDPFHIYRESIAITPILVRYLSKNYQHRQDELVLLIKQECLRLLVNRIENCDESPETVDLCIATICLYGIDYVRENIKLISNSLLRVSFSRFKYISMILRQFYFTGNRDDTLEKKTTKFISNMTQNHYQDESSRIQFSFLLNAIRSSLARLVSSTTSILIDGRSASDKRLTLHLPNALRKEYNFLNDLLLTDIRLLPDRKSCSLLHHFTKLFWILEYDEKFATQYRVAQAMDTIPEYLLFHNDVDPLFSLAFIPSHLQNLYSQLLKQDFIIINWKHFTIDDRPHLYFAHILIESLMLISNTSCKRLSILGALIALLPSLRMHQLENFGSSLLWPISTKLSNYLNDFETVKQRPLDYETGLYINRIENIPAENDMADDERRILIKNSIDQEHERLQTSLNENDGNYMKLYSACISLARVSQWTDNERRLRLLEESIQGAMVIHNKLTRLDALCAIAFYSHSNYDQIQVQKNRSLQEEIEYQFNDIYSDLPLLLCSAIFIRCLPLLQNKQMIHKCLQNLFYKFNNAASEEQQVVYEALSPYLQSLSDIPLAREPVRNKLIISKRLTTNRSSVLMEYMNYKMDDTLSFSLFILSMYLAELTGDFHEYLTSDFHYSLLSNYNNFNNIDESILTIPLELKSSILTVAQVLMITNILCSISSSKQLCVTTLNNALHRFDLVEFKACHLLESWMKWKDSNELSSFAYHAALLLINSDFWSVEAAAIICDLLCYENDRFRQRAETVLRFESEDDVRTSSKLGIDVLLTLAKKRAHYQHTSPSASLTLLRLFEDTVIDIQSHLEIVLWLERYRIHAWMNKEFTLTASKLSPISYMISYFPTGNTMDVSFCDNIRQISHELMRYMCTLIRSNFEQFLEIDGDKTSSVVLESHTQFVVSVLVFLFALCRHTDETRYFTIDTLIKLTEDSINDEVCRAAAYALGYICEERTHRILFEKLEQVANENNSDCFLCSLISSYCHCASVRNITLNNASTNLFRKLLKHPSPNVLKTVDVGLGRILKNSKLLVEMLDSNYIRCYHALVESTSFLLLYKASEKSADAAADFLEQHPDLLPILIVELYNSIYHFTREVSHIRKIDYSFAYGNPQYLEIASIIGTRMPAAFCGFIKDWCNGDKLKSALFYTSKQHKLQQRAACLTILSIFGELTIELCEMLIEGLRDDPYIQNTCYKCLTRINAIKDKNSVLNLLFSYLKSNSMNTRYAAAKMLLQLSQYSLISSNEVQKVLNDLMLDPQSNEDLWLIKLQDGIVVDCIYYYAGSLKDVIYSLLVQHLISDSSGTNERNVLNDINLDFVESEKASRLAACQYEVKTEEDFPWETSSKKPKMID